jgi:hypothetical protein
LNISDHQLFEGAYYQQQHPKDSIFLHDSGGHFRPDWLIESWGRDRKNSTNKIRSASAYVIGGLDPSGKGDKQYDGAIFRCFDDEMWSHHLFVKSKSNTFMNQKSIGIEICNYGPLIKTDSGDFYTHTNLKVNKNQVTELNSPFRGNQYYHSYTPAQIKSLKELLLKLSNDYEINLQRGLKKEMDKFGIYGGFELSEDASRGGQGLWSHTNVRVDKSGCFPHPDLISIIKSF